MGLGCDEDFCCEHIMKELFRVGFNPFFRNTEFCRGIFYEKRVIRCRGERFLEKPAR